MTLLKRDVGTVGGDLARAADEGPCLGLLLLIAALGLAAGAIAVSDRRRDTVVHLGVGVAVAAVLLIVAYGVTRSLALDRIDGPEARAAAGAVWDAFLGDLRTAAWILAGAGAVVAATAASVIRPVAIDEPLRRLGRWFATEPRRPALRALRGAGLILAGLILLVRPDAVLRLVSRSRASTWSTQGSASCCG